MMLWPRSAQESVPCGGEAADCPLIVLTWLRPRSLVWPASACQEGPGDSEEWLIDCPLSYPHSDSSHEGVDIRPFLSPLV